MESQLEALAGHACTLDKHLGAIDSRSSGVIREWSELVHSSSGKLDLVLELPECDAWRALRKSFDNLEDLVAELDERIDNMDKGSDEGMDGGQTANFSAAVDTASESSRCPKFRVGKCSAGAKCRFIHLAERSPGKLNEDYIQK